MKYCINCGAPIEPGAKFCRSCGAPAGEPSAQNQGQNQNGYYQNPYGNAYQQNAQYRQAPYGAPAAPVRPVSFGQKNIAVAIILSIVTLGIYGIIWFVNMVDQVNEASENQAGSSGGTVFLLSLVTCGIYQLIWLYKAGELLNVAKARRGMYTDSNSGVMYLLLSVFGLGIVSYALIQGELNKIAEYHGAPRP